MRIIKIFLFVFSIACSSFAHSQVENSVHLIDPYKDIDTVVITETLYDSAILYSRRTVDLTVENLHYMLAGEYADFDDSEIHYPHSVFEKTDTILLDLLPGYRQCYAHPFEDRVTSRFGPRWGRVHYGIDIKLYTGDSVKAAFDGVVRVARRNRTYGYLIVIRHYNGLETYYAHLSKLLVKTQQVVRAGDVIALGGNTGRSRGAHLHFEIRYRGAAFNPEHIINFQNYNLMQDTLLITRSLFDVMISSTGARYHLIRQGETLGIIALRYNTTVSWIQHLNSMQSSNIRAGRTIRVH